MSPSVRPAAVIPSYRLATRHPSESQFVWVAAVQDFHVFHLSNTMAPQELSRTARVVMDGKFPLTWSVHTLILQSPSSPHPRLPSTTLSATSCRPSLVLRPSQG